MDKPVESHLGLAQAFTQVWLLPELLDDARAPAAVGPPAAWVRAMAHANISKDTIAEIQLTSGQEYAYALADDAWSITQRLQLVDKHGLTEAGHTIARAAEYVENRYSGSVLHPGDVVLDEQIRKCYRGADDLSIVELVEEAVYKLHQVNEVWEKYCPHLLLIELEALIYLGGTDARKAETLVGELVQHRIEALRLHDTENSNVFVLPQVPLCTDHAITNYYNDQLPGSTDKDVLTPGSVRATAVWIGLCGVL